MQIIHLQVDNLNVEIHPDSEAAGRAAARAAARSLRDLAAERDTIGVLFATGASQLDMLRAMVSERDIPWAKINGFHLDEYIGLDADHPGSFRRYLRDNLTPHTRLRSFHEIDGSSPDPERVCREYAEALRRAEPQLCLLGIGENGHLAFNDPGVANFDDPKDMKIVALDAVCRQQQAAEGWFDSLDDVPARALTVTIPTLLRVPRLIATVPGERKAHIIRRALHEPVSPLCPATVLRTHPAATLYLDLASAAELEEISAPRATA